MAIVKRSKEYFKGFNVNALGFAGYILVTEESDINWLKKYGPVHLLDNLVESI